MLLAETQMRPTKGELALWQNQYVKACAELNQWETVGKYAQAAENYSLLTECLTKLQEWQRLKEEVLPKAMVRLEPCSRVCVLSQESLSLDSSSLDII